MAQNWKAIRDNAISSERPTDWPPNVRAISMDGVALFGVDERTRELYWDGQKLVTDRKISLEGWTLALAVIATTATAVAAIWPIAVHLQWFGL